MPIIKSGTLNEEEYVKALCSGKIGLGILSKWNRNLTTSRVFDIPACGIFLLVSRNPSMQNLYREGVEAEFFSSTEELVQKARFYLEHEEKRKNQYKKTGKLLRDRLNWKNPHVVGKKLSLRQAPDPIFCRLSFQCLRFYYGQRIPGPSFSFQGLWIFL